jgi:hypothetical protein
MYCDVGQWRHIARILANKPALKAAQPALSNDSSGCWPEAAPGRPVSTKPNHATSVLRWDGASREWRRDQIGAIFDARLAQSYCCLS